MRNRTVRPTLALGTPIDCCREIRFRPPKAHLNNRPKEDRTHV